MSGHHCRSCTCDPAEDTIFTRYVVAEDKREASTKGKCSGCKAPLSTNVGQSVTVTYTGGAKRYYCQSDAKATLGWNGEYTSTTAERLIVASARLDAGVIDEVEFGRILDEVSG